MAVIINKKFKAEFIGFHDFVNTSRQRGTDL